MTSAHDALPELLIAGASGFGRETAETVRALNAQRPTWRLIGFLDDAPGAQGREIDGLPVVGTVGDVSRHPRASVVVCTGSPRDFGSRRRIVERLALPTSRYATLVHPQASLAGSTSVGPGSVVLAGVVATASVRIGSHVAVMPQVVLTHDVVVGDYATFGAGVRLSGGVEIGAGAYIGSGALVREHLRVGARALIGMGSVVLDDVPEAEVWIGAPARRLRLPVAAAGAG